MNLPKFLLISLVVLLVTAVSIFVVAFINNVESVWEKSSHDFSEILSDSLSDSSSESLADSLLVVTTEETEIIVLQEKSGSEQIKNANSTSNFSGTTSFTVCILSPGSPSQFRVLSTKTRPNGHTLHTFVQSTLQKLKNNKSKDAVRRLFFIKILVQILN